jgi:Protein phosphatase 2C
MKRQHHLSKNTLTQRIRTSGFAQQWKTVNAYTSKLFLIAHFAKDRVAGDPNCGIFGVFDGHGGRQVADHCAERVPEELKKEI